MCIILGHNKTFNSNKIKNRKNRPFQNGVLWKDFATLMTKIDVTIGAWGLYNYYRMEVSVYRPYEIILCIFTVHKRTFSRIKLKRLFFLDLEGGTQRAIHLIHELGPYWSYGKPISGDFLLALNV